jgi:hypothetical protein
MRAFTVLLCLPILLLAESAAGLKWSAPTGWKNEGPRPMRAATYSVPAAAGDHESAECAVHFFGAGQGGSIEANLDRWKGQFLQNGQPANAQTGKRTVHGLPVTTIESAGDYTGMGGPMSKEATVKHGYRLLGAIIEGPGGNIFIKFAGPAKTVAANQHQFDQLLASFAKE